MHFYLSAFHGVPIDPALLHSQLGWQPGVSDYLKLVVGKSN